MDRVYRTEADEVPLEELTEEQKQKVEQARKLYEATCMDVLGHPHPRNRKDRRKLARHLKKQ